MTNKINKISEAQTTAWWFAAGRGRRGVEKGRGVTCVVTEGELALGGEPTVRCDVLENCPLEACVITLLTNVTLTNAIKLKKCLWLFRGHCLFRVNAQPTLTQRQFGSGMGSSPPPPPLKF